MFDFFIILMKMFILNKGDSLNGFDNWYGFGELIPQADVN